MRPLLGFREARTTASEQNIIDLVVKSHLNRTQHGEFNTTQEVDVAINALKQLPQTVNVQERILDLENIRIRISSNLESIMMDKDVFDTELEEALANAARSQFQNPRQMIGSYAAILGDAHERFDSEVLAKIHERGGATDGIPADIMEYRNRLDERTRLYTSIFNSYNFVDQDTNELGTLSPDAFAFVIDTNPADGSIRRIDIVPSGEVDKNTYMRTDISTQMMGAMPAKRLPIYLRTFDGGLTDFHQPVRSAVLGDFTFSGVNTANRGDDLGPIGIGELKIQAEGEGLIRGLGRTITPTWFGLEENLMGRSQPRLVGRIREEGINLKNLQFNNDVIPQGAIVKMGSRVFYSSDQENEMFEISGRTRAERMENARKHLQNIGKDPILADTPHFIHRSSLMSPDGHSRVKGKIDENFLAPPSPSTPPPLPGAVQQASPQAAHFARTEPVPLEEGQIVGPSRPPSLIEPRESVRGFPSVPDVIQKGASFFREKSGAGRLIDHVRGIQR